MAEYLSVPTLLKARFRKVRDAESARCRSARTLAAPSQREEILAASRLSEDLVRFLLEMDRKLDIILSFMEQNSRLEEFPLEGKVVELSGAGLVLETSEPLRPGDHMELLLILDDLPLRMVSLIACVEKILPGPVAAEAQGAAYGISFVSLDAEDREAVIQYVFQEDRRRIRIAKEQGVGEGA